MKLELKKIVTHPGGAHKDDLLGVAVLIALSGAEVIRRDPTEEELRDPAIAVVDIGGVHDPETHCFDHHHFPREHPPTCALSLVLDHLGLYEDAKQFCEWLEPAEWFDSRGPKKTAEHLGVARSAIPKLLSPLDITALRRFASKSELKPGDTLYEFMRFAGQDLLDYLRVARERLDAIAAQVSHVDVDGGALEVIFLPRTDPIMDEPSNAVKAYVRTLSSDRVAAIIYPDRRGDGYGIARYEDHPRLDFSRTNDEPDVHFAHKSGFMCKTSATELPRLLALVEQALSPA